MQTARLYSRRRSQTVRLPSECRFDGNKVGIRKIGSMVILFPQEKADELFFSSIGNFTDDFFEVMEHRNDHQVHNPQRLEL
jgi:antitoxin VapB